MNRYYITDRKAVGGFRPLLEIIRDQMHLGVRYIQIREKDVPARELFVFAQAVVDLREREFDMLAPTYTKLFINSRADIALASGADGVHLPAAAPRETLPGLLIGRSCHTIEEVRSAQADFVTFGPVFASPGKGPSTGLAVLAEACRHHPAVYALGGITWANAASCVQAGAMGIAGIRLFQEPDLD